MSSKVLQFFEDFHRSAYIPRGANSSFIALTPKKKKPCQINDFRPISLINCSIKLLLKVLANRLKHCLQDIISEEQSSFITGRNITDSIFMVNEVIHLMQYHKIDGFILKLDISKAYDSVDWSCLIHVMRCINMGKKWISRALALFQSTRMSILVNGSPTSEFYINKGLRQGYPMAPYLFLLVTEVLSKLINTAKKGNRFIGVQLHFFDTSITHFQYTDDTILFVSNQMDQLLSLKSILSLFQAITGLLINYKKSQLYHPQNELHKLQIARKILGCEQGIFPFKYLGDWVGTRRKLCSTWSMKKDNMSQKLGN